MRNQCFWLQGRRGCKSGSDLIIGRCEQERGKENQLACKCIVAKKTTSHSCALVDCWLQQNQQTLNSPDSIWGVQIQFWWLVYSEDDLCTILHKVLYFLYLTVLPCSQKVLKCLHAEGLWKEMIPSIFNEKSWEKCPPNVPIWAIRQQISHFILNCNFPTDVSVWY